MSGRFSPERVTGMLPPNDLPRSGIVRREPAAPAWAGGPVRGGARGGGVIRRNPAAASSGHRCPIERSPHCA